MAIAVRILPSSELFIRDPQETKLGQRILHESIYLLDELGLENFTFRKLAQQLNSVEASIYRYFSSKHQLLQYLVGWYWDWVHYLVNLAILPYPDPKDKLEAAIEALTLPSQSSPITPYIDESVLHRVVVHEGSKAIQTKQVDDENIKGCFTGYKSLITSLSDLITDVSPDFPYPKSLATSLFEQAHRHPYYVYHLPSLTDLKANDELRDNLTTMLLLCVRKLLSIDDQSSIARKGNSSD